MFPTTTKDSKTIGLAGLRAVCSAVAIPVVAIGGVSQENAAETVRAGAKGVAVISALFAKDNVLMATRELASAVHDALAHPEA